MNKTDIRETLDEESIRLTKSLGQNLLHDQNVLRRIAKAGDLSPTDKVLESAPASARSRNICCRLSAISPPSRWTDALKKNSANALVMSPILIYSIATR
jgi:hypothetical protein